MSGRFNFGGTQQPDSKTPSTIGDRIDALPVGGKITINGELFHKHGPRALASDDFHQKVEALKKSAGSDEVPADYTVYR